MSFENMVLIEDIKIEQRLPGDRGDINDLMESMKNYGQFHPILIDENNVLIAGFRRLSAAKALGWKYVEVKVKKNWGFFKKKCVELEENIRRKDMSWVEKDMALAELHRIKQEYYGEAPSGGPREFREEKGWSLADTARETGFSDTAISLAIKMSDAIKIDPTLAAESSRSVALQKLKRREANEIRKILAQRSSALVMNDIILGDALSEVRKLKDESISLIVTDPPYGVEINKMYENNGVLDSSITSFSDGFGESLEVIQNMRDEFWRVLTPNSHLYMFCAHLMAMDILMWYSKIFNVRAVPLTWNKVIAGYNPNKGIQWSNNTELILFMWKGTREFNSVGEGGIITHHPHRGDILTFMKPTATSGKVGINEKPVDLISNLILLSSNKGEVVLDPFCGTGTTGVAAQRVGRKFILVDKNPEVIPIAKVRVNEEIERGIEKES